MNIATKLLRIAPSPVKNAVRRIYSLLPPGTLKGQFELQYWKSRLGDISNGPYNGHYEELYTKVFGVPRDDYNGKRVLDIGCGPRGSLEWADMTAQRVGLDPLVPQYLKLGAKKHKMEYCASGSEHIPFPDHHFDIVACLNALDHVDDLDATIGEIKRVTKPGGLFLLSVEIDHPPTSTEPITINMETLRKLAPEFEATSEFKVGTPADHDLHRAVATRQPAYIPGEPGIYVARFSKV